MGTPTIQDFRHGLADIFENKGRAFFEAIMLPKMLPLERDLRMGRDFEIREKLPPEAQQIVILPCVFQDFAFGALIFPWVCRMFSKRLSILPCVFRMSGRKIRIFPRGN